MGIEKGLKFHYTINKIYDKCFITFSMIYYTFSILLPIRVEDKDFYEPFRSWGIYWQDSLLCLVFGRNRLVFGAPWKWQHVQYEVLYPDGWKKPEIPWQDNDGRIVETFDYKYKLKNGKIQNRKATVYVGERTYKWSWFTWLPWPKKVCKSITVQFDNEVGEQTGSWKGGVLGCGYDMEPDETIEQTLRRMEKERKFE